MIKNDSVLSKKCTTNLYQHGGLRIIISYGLHNILWQSLQSLTQIYIFHIHINLFIAIIYY